MSVSEDYGVTYRRDGYVVLRDVLQPTEVTKLRQEARRLWQEVDVHPDNPRVQWRSTLQGDRVADRIDPVFDVSPVFEGLARDERLLSAVGTALGERAQAFKCKLISKWSGTNGYSLHRDYPYWQSLGVPARDLLNVQVALSVCDPRSGAIEVLPGMLEESLAAAVDDDNDLDESRVDCSSARHVDLHPGDVALFHSMIPHRSGPNRSTHDRESLIISYAPVRCGDLYERYYRQRQATGLPPALRHSRKSA